MSFAKTKCADNKKKEKITCFKNLLIDFFKRVLTEHEFDLQVVQISTAKVVEAINFAARDLKRIENDLEHGASREKFAAYHAFWVARLKPITNVLRPGDNGHEEVVDINERLAVILAVFVVGIGLGRPVLGGRKFWKRLCPPGA